MNGVKIIKCPRYSQLFKELYLRVKSLFFNIYDVMKTVFGAKIP